MIYEKNIVQKKINNIDIRFASVYPNVYKTAMSSLGYQIIYGMVNDREDSWCERIVYPSTRSIESNSPLNDFDIISFSLQYEEDYFNVLKILKNANIPIKRTEREKNTILENKKYPLIIAGGPCATANPLAISDFIDIFIIGEAEAILNDFLNLYKKLNNPLKEIDQFLNLNGVYISKFDNIAKRVILENMDNSYQVTKPIVVETEKKEDSEFLPVFGNSILLNVSRACSRGCRFCMSGYLYRPLRETSLERLFSTAEKARDNTGLNKVTLIGAAVSDYSKIDELTEGLLNRKFQISTPSMRIESITKDTLKSLKKSGAKTITIAPESIYSLRKSINKNITDEEIFELVKNSLKIGFNIKLYFLIGLIGEEKEDIEKLAILIKKINDLKYSYNKDSYNEKNNDEENTANTYNEKNTTNNINNKKNTTNNTNDEKNSNKVYNNSIKFSINPLIPKPQTPMEWEGYDLKDIKSKIKYLRKNLKGIDIKFNSAKMGLIQYVLSCKGFEIGKLIEKSMETKVPIKEWEKYSLPYDLNDKLPWKNIDIGLNHDFLKNERKKLFKKELTPWCEKEDCYNCGSCSK